MLTILEGPDGGGKTTLAAALQAEFPQARYIHNGPSPGLSSALLFEQYLMQLEAAYTVPIILDRCWISEGIYGLEHRGCTRLTVEQVQNLEAKALELGALLVLCKPSFKKCLLAFGSGREEMLRSCDALRDVYQAYTALKTKLPVVVYDYRLYPSKPEAFIAKVKGYQNAPMAYTT